MRPGEGGAVVGGEVGGADWGDDVDWGKAPAYQGVDADNVACFGVYTAE